MDELLITHMRWQHPVALWLLLALPLLLLWPRRRGGVAFGAYALAAAALDPSRGPLLHRLLLVVGLGALIVALARPQYGRYEVLHDERHGRDLMLVVDVSLSMIADDMVTDEDQMMTRLEAVGIAARDLIRRRNQDRIGLVLFAGDAVTACIPSHDHNLVEAVVERCVDQQLRLWRRVRHRWQPYNILGDGTNIGLGLGIALRRLLDIAGPARDGRSIILITDGRDTPQIEHWVDPLPIASGAATAGIQIHTVGVGDRDGSMSDPEALFAFGHRRRIPVTGGMLPDPQRLAAIARAGNGISAHADDRAALDDILRRIEDLDPVAAPQLTRPSFVDRHRLPLVIGLLLITVAIVGEPRWRGVC